MELARGKGPHVTQYWMAGGPGSAVVTRHLYIMLAFFRPLFQVFPASELIIRYLRGHISPRPTGFVFEIAAEGKYRIKWIYER